MILPTDSVGGPFWLVGPDNKNVFAALRSGTANIECRFQGKWTTPLARYNNGDTIKVIGWIANDQTGQQLYLRDCELQR
jgi:hypothetical protein